MSAPGKIIHATAVAVAGRGVLILGPSGSGKSALALALMGFGAQLIADDQVCLRREVGQVFADAPEVLRGRIEARHVGILNARPAGETSLALVVNLAHQESERLPPRREHILLGQALPLLHKSGIGSMAPAIVQYLKGGRSA